MRNMSFMLTIEQIKNQTKTVTRRNGWDFLKVGDYLRPVEKCQGLKKDEKIKAINSPAIIKVIDIRKEPLNAITKEDCIKEGFPEMTPEQFVAFYAKHNKCPIDFEVTRIEFGYVSIQINNFLTDV